jgi:hypothetical protein
VSLTSAFSRVVLLNLRLFSVCTIVCRLVLFLLVIVLSAVFLFTTSDYTFIICIMFMACTHCRPVISETCVFDSPRRQFVLLSREMVAYFWTPAFNRWLDMENSIRNITQNTTLPTEKMSNMDGPRCSRRVERFVCS